MLECTVRNHGSCLGEGCPQPAQQRYGCISAVPMITAIAYIECMLFTIQAGVEN